MKLVFTGDLLLGDQPLLLGMGIQSRYRRNYSPVFDDFCGWFKTLGADALVVNCEGVLVEDVLAFPPYERATKAPLEALALLRGLDTPVLVSVANNHSMEYGPEAFANMRRLLEAGGFRVLGLKDRPAEFIRTAETTVGVLAFSTVPALYGCEPGYLYVPPEDGASVEKLLELVRQSRSQCDYLVVYPHWGTEFMTEPNRTQRELAARLVEAGACMIVGAHPHVTQAAYRVSEAPVYYSLGNLVSDYPLKGMNKSAVVVAEFGKDNFTSMTRPFDADAACRIRCCGEESMVLSSPRSDWPDDESYFKEGSTRRRNVRNEMLAYLLRHLPKALCNFPLIAWMARRAWFLAVNRRQLSRDPNSIYSGPIH